jgi:TetR/AcrR family transcriptional regulator, cholesterol catabolism regulator
MGSFRKNTDFNDEVKKEAIWLFFRMGIKKVKMDTLAKRMKISKRTIYESFRDKETLITEAIDYMQREQNEINKKILNESENTIEAVMELLKNGSALVAKISPLYFQDLRRLYPKIWNEKIKQSKTHSYKIIHSLLKKGISEGIYRKDINEEIISLILIEQLYMLSDPHLFPGKKFHLAEVYENIILTMTRGLLTARGLKLLDKYLDHSEKIPASQKYTGLSPVH